MVKPWRRNTVHRYTSDSKIGRQIAAMNTHTVRGSGPTPEQQAHNARIDAARQADLQRRQQRRKRNDHRGD